MRALILFILTSLLAAQAAAQVAQLSNEELKAMLDKGVPVIDVRRPDEWRQTGVIQGAHLLTFFDKSGKYDVNAWMADFSKVVKKGQPFVLICRTGNRTSTISKFLDEQLHYPGVGHAKNGITAWISAGNPVVKPNN